MDDVIVIGGGVIGLSVRRMAGQGAAVTVLEQGDFGREASWAGGDACPPAISTPRPRRIPSRALSHALWPDWAESLAAETGIETGYTWRRTGTAHGERRRGRRGTGSTVERSRVVARRGRPRRDA